MNYEVIFDIMDAGYRCWWFPAVGLAALVLGLLFIRFRKFLTLGAISGYGPLPRWFGGAWIAIGSIFFVFASIVTLTDYVLLRSAASHGKLSRVEGVVANLIEGSDGDRTAESFEVGGQLFKYSSGAISAGFNHTKAEGGPIDNGLTVRIWHLNGEIARLEVEVDNKKANKIQQVTSQ